MSRERGVQPQQLFLQHPREQDERPRDVRVWLASSGFRSMQADRGQPACLAVPAADRALRRHPGWAILVALANFGEHVAGQGAGGEALFELRPELGPRVRARPVPLPLRLFDAPLVLFERCEAPGGQRSRCAPDAKQPFGEVSATIAASVADGPVLVTQPDGHAVGELVRAPRCVCPSEADHTDRETVDPFRRLRRAPSCLGGRNRLTRGRHRLPCRDRPRPPMRPYV